MLYNLPYPLSVDYSILSIFQIHHAFRSTRAAAAALTVKPSSGPFFHPLAAGHQMPSGEILKEVKGAPVQGRDPDGRPSNKYSR